MTYCNRYLEKIANSYHDMAVDAGIGGGLGLGAGIAADYVPSNHRIKKFLPNSKMTGAVGGAVSNIISGRIGDAVMKKQAAEQDLRDYASDYTSYQEPILKNVLTGATVGGFGGTVMAVPRIIDKIVAMKAISNSPEQLAKATEQSARLAAKYSRIGSLAGAGAGLAWGVRSHLLPHQEHVSNNSHIDGVVEYSKRHIDPALGALPSAVAGGYIAGKLGSKIPLPANPILRTALSLAPGLAGAIAGEKLGTKGMNAYNDYVLNDVASKHYQ